MRTAIVAAQRIERAIFLVRGQKVMLDADLAVLYGVPTGALVQAAKRNRVRFPTDFMFQLTRAEAVSLRSQVEDPRGGIRWIIPAKAPYFPGENQRCAMTVGITALATTTVTSTENCARSRIPALRP